MRLPRLTLSIALLVSGISPTLVGAQQPAAAPTPAEKPAAVEAAPAKSPAKASTKATATVAADPVDPKAADLLAIRQGSQPFVTAFNQGDAAAIAALWTEDGEYVDEQGQKFVGRATIQQGYESFFANHPGTKIHVVIDALKMLSPTAAIEDGRAILDPAPSGAPGSGKYTAVHVKVDGKWLLSTVRDQRVESPSGYHNIADLEWLIGTWTTDSPTGKMESVCRWVANKSFVERTYTSTRRDGTSTTGVQLIGFNPQTGQIQSWNFSSDGGLAIGIWTPRENGWMAELQGTLGDGTPTTAVNLLTRLDNHTYAWQSVQRTVANIPLQNTDEVIMKRSAAE